ncbi:hypothetical protein PR003_g8423 [Phytophthora rubi]|uniref:Uncharacterized protein n=1 Tax=Phytophthora rubi TaxID=129364 RepID=A0A6A4FB82_9STRA|nr:hypothetical protein PR003_g8423 [Phytophthora rubi]
MNAMPSAPYTAVWVLLLPKRMILVCVSINTVGTPTRTHVTRVLRTCFFNT